MNLRKKYGRYRGNTDFYHRDVAEKRSYYNMAASNRAADALSKSVMVEKSYGKYQSDQKVSLSVMVIGGGGGEEKKRLPP